MLTPARSSVHVSMVFVLCMLPALCPGAYAQGDQYKRYGLDAMAKIVDGAIDEAKEDMAHHLEAFPNDPEFLYVLAVAHAQEGDVDAAFNFARQAVSEGLPVGRLVAGSRRLLAPLHDDDAFQEWVDGFGMEAELIQGPMLGSVTSGQMSVWLRTSSEVTVTLVVTEDGEEAGRIDGETSASDDHTIVLSIDGLKPDTEYRYAVEVNGRPYPASWTVRTMPEEGRPARFQIGFGGGAGYTPWHERIWTTIDGNDFSAFLMMGDNVYHDHPTRPDVQRYTYYRRQSRPEFRAFSAETPLFAIWDDHDFGENDSWGGPSIDEPDWKQPVWQIFKQNWANPSYGGGEEQPGVWFDFSIGDVDFFMLDGRYYRTDPKIDRPSMLGPAQKAWLFDEVAASDAAFKVIVSPVPWAQGAKGGTQMTPQGPQPGGLDTWDGFPEERDEIFSFLAANEIDGVVLLSADRHRSDAWRIARADGYALYEFESSQLTNVHTHDLMDGALFGYNEKNSFGRLTFDTQAAVPTVTYEIVSIDGEAVADITVPLSRLTHGD